MLVDVDRFMEMDRLDWLNALFADSVPQHIETGVYQFGHFNSSNTLRTMGVLAKDSYEEFSHGVCDNYKQILEKWPELISSDRRFVISLTRVAKANQDKSGGWRWHKWGAYIGDYVPMHEYLYDEDIDEVYVFHIDEVN